MTIIICLNGGASPIIVTLGESYLHKVFECNLVACWFIRYLSVNLYHTWCAMLENSLNVRFSFIIIDSIDKIDAGTGV